MRNNRASPTGSRGVFKENRMKKVVEIKHGHVFCGIGGGAKGMNRGRARLGNLRAKFRCVGGIDVDPGAVASFSRLAGVPGTVMDLFTLEQYFAFHGHTPPPGWREAVPADLMRAFGNEWPNIGFMSSPCKGFSGLLSQAKSETSRYRALNELALRGLWLYLEAGKDNPSEFILFENVPRIQTRGRPLLDQIIQLLQHYGYATAETTHDCGRIARRGLAQSRKRFLLVARHQEKVPAFLYQAPLKPLRAVGDVLEKFPLPGDPAAGAMHRSPALQWKTWVRLAFVEAGSDWRSLKKLRVENGVLADYLIVPERRGDYLGVVGWDQHAGTVSGRGTPTCGRYSVGDPRIDGAHHGVFGINEWDQPAGTVQGSSRPANGNFGIADPRGGEAFAAGHGVAAWGQPSGAIAGESFPSNGRFSVADPRIAQTAQYAQLGVRSWSEPTGAVTGQSTVGGGAHAIADPRLAEGRYNNVFRIVRWSDVAPAVTAGTGPTSGGNGVADPRCHAGFEGKGKYIVTPFDSHANTVIAASTTGNGASAVADPRYGWKDGAHESKMRVQQWDEASRTVTGSDRVGSGALSIADPRTGFGDSTHHNVLHVTPWDEHSKTVTGANHPSGGALAVGDPRCGFDRDKGDAYLTSGHYGVLPWESPAYAVTAHASHDNGHHSVADPRMPISTERLVCVIRALDGTWHRPFTTLELAALQSLVEPEEHLMLEGMSDSQWREWIGNCVPPDTAEMIASLMGRAYLGSMMGETFMLSSEPVWVRPVAIALSLARSA